MVPLGGTAPTPLLIVADAAFADVHVRVTLPPGLIEAGEAANVTVGVAGVAARPTQPVSKPVVKLNVTISGNKRQMREESLFMSVFGRSGRVESCFLDVRFEDNLV